MINYKNGIFIHKGVEFHLPYDMTQYMDKEDLSHFYEYILSEIDRIIEEKEKCKNVPRLWNMVAKSGFLNNDFKLSPKEIYFESKKLEPPKLRTPKEIYEEFLRKKQNDKEEE